MGFPKSLGFGKHGEGFVQQVFEKAGIVCCANEDKETRQDYDLVCKIGRTKFTCEVKFDVMSKHTGNWAIETFNSKSNCPSGLTATKANLWAHILPDGENKTLWITNVKSLIKFCNDVQPLKLVKFGGDKNAVLKIYRHEVISVIFERMDILSTDIFCNKIIKMIKSNKDR